MTESWRERSTTTRHCAGLTGKIDDLCRPFPETTSALMRNVVTKNIFPKSCVAPWLTALHAHSNDGFQSSEIRGDLEFGFGGRARQQYNFANNKIDYINTKNIDEVTLARIELSDELWTEKKKNDRPGLM
jgi:hypothetical protein